MGGYGKLAAEIIKLWLFSLFYIYQSAPCFCFIFSSLEIVLLPLAANADEDNEDGDHKGRRCCDGSQEQ